ncbi:MAG TPA: hypothetical protein VK644_05265 [Chitinophagaceae bacterium]|nr:hypothetical protein [Chitinophagaceae bacterium]
MTVSQVYLNRHWDKREEEVGAAVVVIDEHRFLVFPAAEEIKATNKRPHAVMFELQVQVPGLRSFSAQPLAGPSLPLLHRLFDVTSCPVRSVDSTL